MTVWKGEFWKFGKREFWQFGKGKFWQFGKEKFDSLKRKISTVWKGKILTVWKGEFWQFEKENFDSLKRRILTVWKGEFWQFGKGKFWEFEKKNIDSLKRKSFLDDTQFGDHCKSKNQPATFQNGTNDWLKVVSMIKFLGVADSFSLYCMLIWNCVRSRNQLKSPLLTVCCNWFFMVIFPFFLNEICGTNKLLHVSLGLDLSVQYDSCIFFCLVEFPGTLTANNRAERSWTIHGWLKSQCSLNIYLSFAGQYWYFFCWYCCKYLHNKIQVYCWIVWIGD